MLDIIISLPGHLSNLTKNKNKNKYKWRYNLSTVFHPSKIYFVIYTGWYFAIRWLSLLKKKKKVMRKKKLREKVQKESFGEIKLYRLKKGSQMDEINVITDKNLSLNFCRKEPDNI